MEKVEEEVEKVEEDVKEEGWSRKRGGGCQKGREEGRREQNVIRLSWVFHQVFYSSIVDYLPACLLCACLAVRLFVWLCLSN